MQRRQEIVAELQEKLAEVETTPIQIEALADLWQVSDLLITQIGADRTRRMILASDMLEPALRDVLLALHDDLRKI